MALWTPADLAVPPSIWLDVNLGGYSTSSGAVTSIPNHGSTAGSFDRRSTPGPAVYSATGLGGNPCFVCDGTDPFVASGNLMTAPNPQAAFYLWVGEQAASGGSFFQRVYQNGVFEPFSVAPTFSSPDRAMYPKYNGSADVNTLPFNTATPVMFDTLFSSTTMDITKNAGTPSSIGLTPTTSRSSDHTIFGGYYGDYRAGKMAKFVGLNYTPTTDEIERLRGWAAWSSGLHTSGSGILPPTDPYYLAAPTTGGSGSQTLTPSLFANTNTVHSPTVSQSGGAQTLTPSLFANTGAIHAPTISRGTVTLVPALLGNTSNLHAAAVARGAATLSPGLFSNSGGVYSLTVTPGAVTIRPALFPNVPAFHPPAVFVPGEAQSLLPAMFLNASVIRLPAVSNDNPPGIYPLAIEGRPRTLRTALVGGGAVSAGSIPSTGRVIATALKGRS